MWMKTPNYIPPSRDFVNGSRVNLPGPLQIESLESHCNFETTISIKSWVARSADGLVVDKIAKIRIAAKQAHGQAFELKPRPRCEALSSVARRVNRRTRCAIPSASSTISDAPAGIAGLPPWGTRRAILTSVEARSSATALPLLA